jgi:hypothetical protein
MNTLSPRRAAAGERPWRLSEAAPVRSLAGSSLFLSLPRFGGAATPIPTQGSRRSSSGGEGADHSAK